MSRVDPESTGTKPTAKKQMDMGTWLIILFGLVLLVGFGLMLIDILLR
jgi:hypothetical protein